MITQHRQGEKQMRKELEEKPDETVDEIRELSADELDKASGGVEYDSEPDESTGLCPTQASFEKWFR